MLKLGKSLQGWNAVVAFLYLGMWLQILGCVLV